MNNEIQWKKFSQVPTFPMKKKVKNRNDCMLKVNLRRGWYSFLFHLSNLVEEDKAQFNSQSCFFFQFWLSFHSFRPSQNYTFRYYSCFFICFRWEKFPIWPSFRPERVRRLLEPYEYMGFVFNICEGFNSIHHYLIGAVIFRLVGCIDCLVLFSFCSGSQIILQISYLLEFLFAFGQGGLSLFPSGDQV